MPYTIEKSVLFDLLQKTCPIVPTKSSLQIVSNLKLNFYTDSLEITATDLDHSIKVSGEMKGDGDIEIAVNARKIFDIVKELANGQLSIRIDENVITIKSEDSFECKIAGTDTQDFPVFPKIDDMLEVEIPFIYLNNMIQKSSFAVSKDETRACLCGVLWEIEKKRTGMVATDGHRMGKCFYQADFKVSEKNQSIISTKSLIHLSRIIYSENINNNIKVGIGEKYILFSTRGITLCTKRIEGPYPDYEKVIPKNNPKKALIDRQLLLESVRRVSVLSNQKTHLIKFVFRKNELEIVVLNRDIGGEARQRIPVSYDGEEHVIGFNAQYLSEILSIISTPKVKFEMSTQISACLIFSENESKDKSESEDLFLIMPLRIMEE